MVNLMQKFSEVFSSVNKNTKQVLKNVLESLSERYRVYGSRITTTELVNKVFYFCEVYSGLTFFPYQAQFSKRIIRSVLENDGEEITALFARQSGKSETVATTIGGMMIILPKLANMPMFADDKRLTMFKDGLWVGIFAPGQRQAQITYGRVRDRIQSDAAISILNDPDFNLGFSTSNGQTVALTNGSFVSALSASDGSNIEGGSFKLIVCEECQDISTYKIRKSIHPMGAAYNSTIVKIGTPSTFKGDFFEAIQRNKKEDLEKKSHIKNHFEYDCEVASKYNERYRKYVESEKKRLGENSDEFRMSYKLEWIIERSMFVNIERFEQENTEDLLERITFDKNANHVVGIDLGRGEDSTVVSVVEVDWDMPVIMESITKEETGEDEVYTAYNSYLVDWFTISGVSDFEEQYVMIMDYLSNFRVSKVICDATKEASFSHRLRANLPYDVEPFIFTQSSKSELYKHLLTEIDTGRARVCAGEKTTETREYKEFILELGELQKSYSGKYLVVSHPDERGKHDDYPDSWALAVLGCMDEAEEDETETRRNEVFDKKTNNEKKFMNRLNSITARRR